jgi:hypothetical protein
VAVGGMPPKATPKPFEVDGVDCTVDRNGLVNVGLNAGWDRGDRFPVKAKPGSDVETMRAKVREHHKFARLAARAAAAAQGDPPPSPANPQPAAQTESEQQAASSADVNSAGAALESPLPAAPDADLFGNVAEVSVEVERAGGEGGYRRSARRRSATDMLDPAAELRPGERFRLEGGRATGTRRARAPEEEQECTRPGCVADREKHAELQREHAELKMKYEADTRRWPHCLHHHTPSSPPPHALDSPSHPFAS